MKKNNKIDGYIDRVEKCVPEIIRSIHISMPEEIMGLKLTISQVLTLVALGYKKLCKMSDLAKAVSTKMSAMTGIIDGLIREGLVERERSDDDRRIVLVRLTQKGRRIARRLQEHRKKNICSIIEYLDKSQRESIIVGFEKMIAAFSVRAEEIERSNHR